MLEDEKCAVRCLGAMDKALGGRRASEAGAAEELPAGVGAGQAQPRSSCGRRNQSNLLWQGPEQQHHRGASRCHAQLDTTMVTLSDVACSRLMETRTDAEPLEEEFLAPCETTFMCSYTEELGT